MQATSHITSAIQHSVPLNPGFLPSRIGLQHPLARQKMPLKIRPATPADGPSLGPIYLSAFSDNPVLLTCFPQTSAECRAFIRDSFPEEMASGPRAHWLVVTDPDHADPEQIVAWAKWVRPAREGEASVPPPPPPESWPRGGSPAFADEFFGGIAARHAAVMGEVRHWYLELIVCHKDHQGKGAASPLMRWGCDRADEEGTVAFLESMPKAKVVYEKYGFGPVDYMEFTTPGGEVITQDFMLRKGKAAEDYERVLENIKKLKK